MRKIVTALLLLISVCMYGQRLYDQRIYMHDTWLFHNAETHGIALEDMEVLRSYPAIDISIPQKGYVAANITNGVYIFTYKGYQAICLVNKIPKSKYQEGFPQLLSKEGDISFKDASRVIQYMREDIVTKAGRKLLHYAEKYDTSKKYRRSYVLHGDYHYILLYNIKESDMTLFLDCAKSLKEYPILAPPTKNEMERLLIGK